MHEINGVTGTSHLRWSSDGFSRCCLGPPLSPLNLLAILQTNHHEISFLPKSRRRPCSAELARMHLVDFGVPPGSKLPESSKSHVLFQSNSRFNAPTFHYVRGLSFGRRVGSQSSSDLNIHSSEASNKNKSRKRLILVKRTPHSPVEWRWQLRGARVLVPSSWGEESQVTPGHRRPVKTPLPACAAQAAMALLLQVIMGCCLRAVTSSQPDEGLGGSSSQGFSWLRFTEKPPFGFAPRDRQDVSDAALEVTHKRPWSPGAAGGGTRGAGGAPGGGWGGTRGPDGADRDGSAVPTQLARLAGGGRGGAGPWGGGAVGGGAVGGHARPSWCLLMFLNTMRRHS
ncbi:unnamed protein product [Arctogadus glacialis]